MTAIAVGVIAALVTMCTFFYFGIMSVLLWKLGFEGAAAWRVLGRPLMPTFFQNFGIPLAILGFTFQRVDVVVVAGLFLAFGILSTTEKSISLHPAVEAPMLGLAIASLLSVRLFYAVI
jgi:hypothetical protein